MPQPSIAFLLKTMVTRTNVSAWMINMVMITLLGAGSAEVRGGQYRTAPFRKVRRRLDLRTAPFWKTEGSAAGPTDFGIEPTLPLGHRAALALLTSPTVTPDGTRQGKAVTLHMLLPPTPPVWAICPEHAGA